jgi:galactose mutarotase-like enzyme
MGCRMNHSISDGDFKVEVKQEGAELRSFHHGPSNREFMWGADPVVWAGTAPVLFPIIGRLRNDEYELRGQRYAMGSHGIVRRRDFSRRRSAAAQLVLGTSSDATTRANYPFEFDLEVKFSLEGPRLTVAYCVRNTGTVLMPFSLGSHPAFSLHADAPGVEAYSVEFDQPQTLDLYRLDGPLLGDTVVSNYMDNATKVPLSVNIFDADALIFKGVTAKTISLVRDGYGPEVTVSTGGAPHLGIWAKPAARFVCIEPWYGYADSVHATGRLNDKPGMMWLSPEAEFQAQYSVTVHPQHV